MIVITSENQSIYGLSPRFYALQRASHVLDEVNTIGKSPLVKTASTDSSEAIRLLAKALSEMKLSTNIDLGELFSKLLGSLEKTASAADTSREVAVKIASKDLKDSHYQIDIAKDTVVKDGRKLHMVSVFAKESYLGRYLIKRNYFFVPENAKQADATFDEVERKAARLKKRYYDAEIPISAIFKEVKRFLDGVDADFRTADEQIGTAQKRDL